MNNMSDKEEKEKKKSKSIKTFIIALSIFLFAGGIYYFRSNKTTKHVISSSDSKINQAVMKSEKTIRPLMRAQTPAPITSRQKQELANGTSTALKKKLFEITGGNFYFTPNKITVNQGDKVTIIFLNMIGTHDFVIDSLHVRTPFTRPGQPGVVAFTAGKKGTYEYYSSISQDRQMGMKGTLIIM